MLGSYCDDWSNAYERLSWQVGVSQRLISCGRRSRESKQGDHPDGSWGVAAPWDEPEGAPLHCNAAMPDDGFNG